MYPIVIKREKQIVRFDEVVKIEDNGLTIAALQFVGEDRFTVFSDNYDGYIIRVQRTRLETDEERDARVSREEAYMAEYHRRHPKPTQPPNP
jgi:hypothetical protein